MAVTRLNHAVLYVRDAERTATFFCDLLGFEIASRIDLGGRPGIFLRAGGSPNDHDIAFFSMGAQLADSTAGRATVGMYHLAWEVPTLGELAEYRAALQAAGALVGVSDHGVSKSLYCKDPDGLEFELMWAVPVELMAPDDKNVAVAPLDLEADIARFGADTPGRVTA